MKKVFAVLLFCGLLIISFHLSPLTAHAQLQRNPYTGFTQSGGGGGGSSAPTLGRLIEGALNILNLLVEFAIGLSTVVFLFALVKYVTAGSGEDKAAARTLMIYGIVALFVAVSVWGLVKFIQVATGITGEEQVNAPSLPSF